MYQPSPPAEPATPNTSSAATTVRQPNAHDDLRPLRMDGSAAGSSTSITSRQPRNPRLRAASCVVRLMVRNPVSVLIATGQTLASATTNTIDSGLSPNQIIASGRIAIDGSGLKIALSTVSRSCPTLENTAHDASAKQTSAPAHMPTSKFCNVASVTEMSFPDRRSSASAAPTSSGDDTSSLFTCHSET